MNWLPVHADFRGALRAAASMQSPVERFEALTTLARHRLGYLETIQLDNLLRRSREQLSNEGVTIRLAVLASTTVDHLAPMIRIAGLRRRFLIDVLTGAYGQYRQELFDGDSALYRFAPELVLLSVDAREISSRIAVGASAGEVDRAIDAVCSDLGELWGRARDAFAAQVIQQSMLNVSEPMFGSFDSVVPSAPGRVVRRMNEALAEAASKDGVLLLDVARASERQGIETWFDRARWLQGKIEIAPAVAPLYGDLVARLVAAARGQSKKCLVLDLDNVMWGGVVGDDGLQGLVLGEGSAVGEAHSALQRHAKLLAERGVLLAVCSKNDPAVAEATFRDHPEMVLRRQDIAAFVANWEDKAANLRTIAEQLNIGLDSLVFVDDNPVERARVREALPMVSVPELPDDPTYYVPTIGQAGYFEAVGFTDEDRTRAAQYSANAEREAVRGSAKSMDDFLRDLEMSVVYGRARTVDVARITQLLNKTNQFNTTTRRYSAAQVGRLVEAAAVLQFRLIDRFGDNGLVSVMILETSPRDSSAMELANWVMSCRVFGRQLEHEAMNVAVEAAREQGARSIGADFLSTPRNGVITNLFERLGFERARGSEADRSRWSLDVDRYEPKSTFIQRQEQQRD